uniref:5'-nucleotidase, cytosolic IIIB n=1 Tax=Echeneis naucrates TaxID=173247 RepID=A0A665TGV4_ECHNA
MCVSAGIEVNLSAVFPFVQIPELSKGSVLIRERSRVEETLQAMRRAGVSSLQVISDFDRTLTRFTHNGKTVATTHNILDNRLLMNEDATRKMKELLNTYYPIEIDSNRSAEEKLPLMVEWWTKVHELLIQQKIRKDMLTQAVKESNAMLRDGYKEFFEHLAEHQVPLLIFSAGVGDILEEVIRQNQVFHSNVHIISNYMDFDQTVNIVFSLSVVCLSQVEERKELYANSFGIILVKDETMDVPNAILRYITSSRDNK